MFKTIAIQTIGLLISEGSPYNKNPNPPIGFDDGPALKPDKSKSETLPLPGPNPPGGGLKSILSSKFGISKLGSDRASEVELEAAAEGPVDVVAEVVLRLARLAFIAADYLATGSTKLLVRAAFILASKSVLAQARA